MSKRRYQRMNYADRLLRSPITNKSQLRLDIRKSGSLGGMPFFAKSNSLSYFEMEFRSPVKKVTKSSPKKNVMQRGDLPREPYMKFDTEGISNDYYQNPLDWSKRNCIAFLQYNKPRLFMIETGVFSHLRYHYPDCFCCKFSKQGDEIILGTEDGVVNVLNVETGKSVSDIHIKDYSKNIACIDTDENYMASICFNGNAAIHDQRDARVFNLFKVSDSTAITIKLCHDGEHIVTTDDSGFIRIWDSRNLSEPCSVFNNDSESIKAIDWSPFNKDEIVIGGGQFDRYIKKINIRSGTIVSQVFTGSQICNIFWNKEYNEIVATHGYHDNTITLWRASDLSPITRYYNYKARVLFAATSPDKSKLVTATKDDPLMFWNLFPKSHKGLEFNPSGVR